MERLKIEMGIMERSAKYMVMVSVFRGVGCQAFRAEARKGNTAAVLSLKITRI